MTKSSTYWDKRAISRLTKTERLSEENIAKIHAVYNKAYRDIEKEIQRVYENYSKDTGLDIQKLKELLTKSQTKKIWEQMKHQGLDKYVKQNYKARISRLEQIQAQVYAKAKLIAEKENNIQTETYKGIINDSYYKTIYDTQMGTGYNFSFSQLDNNTIDRMLAERWQGENYSSRIWKNTDILADSLSTTIGSSLLTGASIDKVSRELRERFNVGKYYADRLVRTESSYFHNQSDAMAYEEMGIDKYVFVAVLDSRTSEICQSMDNKVFEYSKMEVGDNFPPLHPNCRSTTRGYLGEEAEKMLQRRARNPITGKSELIPNMSYKEWMNNKSIKPNFTDKTEELLENKVEKEFTIKKLDYYVDERGKKYTDCYFQPDNKIQDEIKYQKYLEQLTGYNVHMVPQVKTKGVRTPDYWFEDTNEYWDFKNLDGESVNIIDNVTGKAKNQTHNLILKQNKTPHSVEYLKGKITEMYNSPYREYIDQIILLDKDDKVIIYYKRK